MTATLLSEIRDVSFIAGILSHTLSCNFLSKILDTSAVEKGELKPGGARADKGPFKSRQAEGES